MTILCETCFPLTGDIEVLSVSPIGPCQQCGRLDGRNEGGVACHIFRDDPRTAQTANGDRATLLPGDLPRDSQAAPCSCGGYADAVETTDDEESEYGCGRYGCCCGAFKCRLCGKRLIARFPAPEME